jgi:hypothetical protein
MIMFALPILLFPFVPLVAWAVVAAAVFQPTSQRAANRVRNQ